MSISSAPVASTPGNVLRRSRSLAAFRRACRRGTACDQPGGPGRYSWDAGAGAGAVGASASISSGGERPGLAPLVRAAIARCTSPSTRRGPCAEPRAHGRGGCARQPAAQLHGHWDRPGWPFSARPGSEPATTSPRTDHPHPNHTRAFHPVESTSPLAPPPPPRPTTSAQTPPRTPTHRTPDLDVSIEHTPLDSTLRSACLVPDLLSSAAPPRASLHSCPGLA